VDLAYCYPTCSPTGRRCLTSGVWRPRRSTTWRPCADWPTAFTLKEMSVQAVSVLREVMDASPGDDDAIRLMARRATRQHRQGTGVRTNRPRTSAAWCVCSTPG